MVGKKNGKVILINRQKLGPFYLALVIAIVILISIPPLFILLRSYYTISLLFLVFILGVVIYIMGYNRHTRTEIITVKPDCIVTDFFGAIELSKIVKITHNNYGNIIIIKMKSGKKYAVNSVRNYGSESMKTFNNFKTNLSKQIKNTGNDVHVVYRFIC